VPAFIFGGRVAVSCAREPEMLAAAIDKALETGDGAGEEDEA
jgi:predicted DsbA family dithiol-disulfide isomerase